MYFSFGGFIYVLMHILLAFNESLLQFSALKQFHYKQEGSYSIGTVGMQDVDCDFVDTTYVSEEK